MMHISLHAILHQFIYKAVRVLGDSLWISNQETGFCQKKIILLLETGELWTYIFTEQGGDASFFCIENIEEPHYCKAIGNLASTTVCRPGCGHQTTA